jgi:hypothetical protein
MEKQVWLLSVTSFVIVVLIGILVFVPAKQTTAPISIDDIQIISPKLNEEVSSPLKITGTVNGNGWSGFEGQAGSVQLLDYKGNKIATGVLTATTDWTKIPVSFESTLIFQTKIIGPMTLLFNNENPSGMPDKNKIFSLSIMVK